MATLHRLPGRTPYEIILEALENRAPLKRVGKELRTLCPAHDDHTPSLDLAESAGGWALLTCRSHGCTWDQIIDALNVRDALRAARNEGAGEWTPYGPATDIYEYVDEHGKHLFQVLRTAGKQFPQRRQLPDGTWAWNLKGVRRVLYRADRLFALVENEEHSHVYVVEGEKDVHALERHGVTATCNPGGAGKWADSYAEQLRGLKVTVISDLDDPGRAHARQVVASLDGVATSVTVRAPAHGKDISDHLSSGHDLYELVELADDITPAQPAAAPFSLSRLEFLALNLEAPPALIGTEADTLIPAGGLVLTAGRAGVGKTTLMLDAIYHLISGRDFLNFAVERALRILLIENEGPQHKFQQKLAAKETVWTHPVGGELHIQHVHWGNYRMTDTTMSSQLAEAIDEHDIDMVMGDPLGSLGVEGVGSPADTRQFIDTLLTLGLFKNVSFWFMHHFRKEPSKDELDQLQGAWGGHLDTLFVLKDNGRPNELRLSIPKVRWWQSETPEPIILGKVHTLQTFEILRDAAEGPRDYLTEIIAYMTGKTWCHIDDIAKDLVAGKDPVTKAIQGNAEQFDSTLGKTIGHDRSRATFYKLFQHSQNSPEQPEQIAREGEMENCSGCSLPVRGTDSQNSSAPTDASPEQNELTWR